MIIKKCYKFRLHPTKEQEQLFISFAGCRRFIWNWALDRKKTHYKATGEGLYCKTLSLELVKLKKQPETAFLRECHSQILQQALRDLDQAFVNFFEKRAKYPKFKSKKRTPLSFRIPQNVKIVDDKVSIPKVGLVKSILHREMEGTIKSATVKQESNGHWFVTFVSHIHIPNACIHTFSSPIGIDVGLESFLTLDSGEKVKPPKFYRRSERKLKRLHRQVSRSQETSKRRAKRRKRLANAYGKIRNQRNDFIHQLSSKLIARYDLLCIEDLNLRGLVRNKRLSKSFSDAALGSFFRALEYKAKWSYRQVVKVGRFYPSSKTCHCCGHIQILMLSNRIWTCEKCEAVHDRDQNSATNILFEGLKIVAVGITETLNANGGNVRRATVRSSC